ncbi:MAG: ComF family protein [Vicinamibacterales bacterium]|nr:ComF family protein [Vicinamibacterales bacterium]
MHSSDSGATRCGSRSREDAREVRREREGFASILRHTAAGAAAGLPGLAWSGLDALLAVLLAPACPVCQSLLERPTRGTVCPACWDAVPRLTPPMCDQCGDPLPSWRVISQDRARCPRCRRRPSALDRGRAVGPYEGTLRRIVHLFKYDRCHTLAAPLGALMRHHGAELLADADCVVPVPLHPRRKRARGFNQAAELAAQLGPPVVHALRRTVATSPQSGLPAGRRHANVRGAFAPTRAHRGLGDGGSLVGDACVVLVDDVATTGATLEACARVLRGCRSREVRALTLARVVTRGPR